MPNTRATAQGRWLSGLPARHKQPGPFHPLPKPRFVLIFLLVLLVAAGCRKPASRDPPLCTSEKLTRIETWLRNLCGAKRRSVPSRAEWRGLSLTKAPLPPSHIAPTAWLMTLQPGKLWIAGQRAYGWPFSKSSGQKPSSGRLGSPSPEEAALIRLIEKHRPLYSTIGQGTQARTKPRLHLAIAPKVPAWQIVHLQRVLEMAKIDRLWLVVSPASVPTPPPRVPGVGQSLINATGRSIGSFSVSAEIRLRRELYRWTANGRCPAIEKLQRAFETRFECDLFAGRPTTDEKDCGKHAENLKNALKSCGCFLDEGPLLAALYTWFQPFEPIAAHKMELRILGDERYDRRWLHLEDSNVPFASFVEQFLSLNVFHITTDDLPRALSEPMVAVRAVAVVGPPFVAEGAQNAITRRVLTRQRGVVLKCYETLLSATPMAKGYLVAHFPIEPNGRISSCSVMKNTLGDQALSRCVCKAILDARHPKTGKARPVLHMVRYDLLRRPPPMPPHHAPPVRNLDLSTTRLEEVLRGQPSAGPPCEPAP